MRGIQKIALTGFYGQGNFGDDLMAVIFGRHLQSLGVPFKVHGFPETYSKRFGFESAHSIEELLEDCDGLVWGGGGFLVSKKTLLAQARSRARVKRLSSLVKSANERDLKFAAFSIGGDGNLSIGKLHPAKAHILRVAKCITVRNQQDAFALRRFGVSPEFYPDVVWQARRFLPVKTVRRVPNKVGVDLYWSNLLNQRMPYIALMIKIMTFQRSDLNFSFMDSTSADKKPFRAVGAGWRGQNVSNYQFHDFEEDMEHLASLGLILSSRLHVPIVALQYHVPFVSCSCEPKTSLFMSNAGLSDYVIHPRQTFPFTRGVFSREKLDRMMVNYPFPDLDTLEMESAGHLDALTRFVGG
jgi:polysaccharide pyruvyl transferase WcaK-like protein